MPGAASWALFPKSKLAQLFFKCSTVLEVRHPSQMVIQGSYPTPSLLSRAFPMLSSLDFLELRLTALLTSECPVRSFFLYPLRSALKASHTHPMTGQSLRVILTPHCPILGYPSPFIRVTGAAEPRLQHASRLKAHLQKAGPQGLFLKWDYAVLSAVCHLLPCLCGFQ